MRLRARFNPSHKSKRPVDQTGRCIAFRKLSSRHGTYRMTIPNFQNPGNNVGLFSSTNFLLSYLQRQRHLSEIDSGLVNVTRRVFDRVRQGSGHDSINCLFDLREQLEFLCGRLWRDQAKLVTPKTSGPIEPIDADASYGVLKGATQ
jgi:hypothetical protein